MSFGLTFNSPSGGQLVSRMVVNRAASEEDLRKKRMQKAWKRYNSDYPEPLLKNDLDPKAEDNAIISLARRTVDTSAFYLFGTDVGFQAVGDGAQFEVQRDGKNKTKSEADTWLDECWEAQDDGKVPFLLEFATGAGIFGDGFLRVHLPNKQAGEDYPSIAALDAENVTAIYDPANYKRVTQYKIEWHGIDGDNKPVAYRHLITREKNGWYIEEQESRGDARAFSTVYEKRWPYKWCPIFHCKNRPMPFCFYGTSDLEDDVLDLNDNINFTVSNNNRILRAHGHPFQWASGMGGNEIQHIKRDIGSILAIPNPEGELHNLEMVSELTSAFNQLKALREAYHEITSIPEIVSGKVENVGQLSGLALKILYGPLVQLTNVKRELYGRMVSQLNVALLEIGGFKAKKVLNQWPTIIPTNRKEEADTAISLQEAGISKDTTIQELGYDAFDENEKRNEESDAALERQKQAFDRGNLTGDKNPFGDGDGDGE